MKIENPVMPSLNADQVSRFRAFIENAPLGIFDGVKGEFSIIPASIQPVVIDDKRWQRIQDDASHILSALEKVGKWLQLREQNQLRGTLFTELSPLEKEAAFGRLENASGFATARLDLFFDEHDLKVIEVNTTIPAMQAYSDMIKHALLKALGAQRFETYQSNTQDLLLSLLMHYERTGGSKQSPRIGIVARQGDSQLAELLWLQREWQKRGYETLLATPDELDLSDGKLWIGSTPIDFTYRHIFAHRLKAGTPFFEACSKAEKFRVFNQISAHLETKSVLAELSRIAADEMLSEAASLNDSERGATNRRVVWSRLLRHGPAVSPEGEFIPDLIPWLKEHQSSLVIKRSLGYGGSGVFLGDKFDAQSTQKRVRELLAVPREVSWGKFIDFCLGQREGQWIVQRKVGGRQISNKFLAHGKIMEQSTYVDCSIFASSGIAHKPKGGASRFSTDAIVNIGQGGGLAPLLMESELRQLMEIEPCG